MLEQSHFWHGLSSGGLTNVKTGAIMEDPKRFNWFLYFTACIVNLTTFTCGVATAWSSPVVSTLQSLTDSPLHPPLTEDEVSWVASLLPLGAIVAPYAAGYLADRIGRKRTLILSAIPTAASFLVLAFARNLYCYYVARFVLGLTTVGMPLTVVPMFIGEVSELHNRASLWGLSPPFKNNRGTLGCFTILYVTLGFLFSFAVGPFTSFQNFNLLCSVAPITFLILFTVFIPETPAYYIMKGVLICCARWRRLRS
ncbi:Sugar transporter [Popillia japonica]|uniref:Sugar transporter n=1 Tax=Popillia japonica TaxID=7064 RepID=A0AAW1JKB8_POPJA